MPIAALAAPLIADLAVSAGLATAGSALATGIGVAGGAALSAGAGAGLGALTGQGAGRGAEIGGFAGLGGGLGGAAGNLVGAPGIGQALGSAVGGGIGSKVGGGSFLTGALEGEVLGGPSSLFGLGGTTGATATTGSGIVGAGGGIATPVAAEATAGAVPGAGGSVLSDTSAEFADRLLNAPNMDFSSGSTGMGGGASGGNVGPFDVGGGMTGPQAGESVRTLLAGTQPSGTEAGAPTPLVPPANAAAGAPANTGTTGILYPGMGDMGGDIPITDVQTAPTGSLGPNSTWFGQPTTPGEAAYNAAPGASKGVLGSIGDMITKNPGGLLTAGLGGYQMLTAKRDMAKELQPLQQAATGAGGMATMLTAPTTSGVLPVGQTQALDNERRKKFAAIEGQAAKTGMAGTTMERDAKIQANADIAEQQVGIEQNLLSQAAGYSRLQFDELTNILKAQEAQDKAYADALTRFASGLASLGGTPKSTTTPTTTPA